MDARSCRLLAPKQATVFLSVLLTKRALSSNPLVPHRRAGVTMSVQVGLSAKLSATWLGILSIQFGKAAMLAPPKDCG